MRWKWSTPMLLAAWLQSACSPVVAVRVSSQDLEKYQNLTAEGLRAQGAASMAEADKQRLPLWAPLHFAQMTALWQHAKQNTSSDRQSLMRDIAGIDKLIADARAVHPDINALLREHLAMAVDLESMELTDDVLRERQSLLGQLRGLVERAEAGQAALMGTEASRLHAQLKKLLIRARQQEALGEFERALAELRAQEAERYVPRTLRTLRESLRDAARYIERYPQHKDAIVQVKKDLARQIQRARGLLAYVRDNEQRARLAFETIAIEEDLRLSAIAGALGVDHPGGAPLNYAALLTAIVTRLAAEDSAGQRAREAQNVLEMQATIAQLRQENAALTRHAQASSAGSEAPLPPPVALSPAVDTTTASPATTRAELPPPLPMPAP